MQGEFEELYAVAYPRVVAYCRLRLPPEDVEEAVADIFTTAWRRRQDLLAANEPMAWLYGVAYRVVSTSRRTARRRRRLDERVYGLAGVPSTDPADEVAASGLLGEALAALERLSERDQEVIRLAAFHQLDNAEIASVMGIRPRAVKSILHRARQRLQKEFAGRTPETGPEERT